MNFLNLTTLIIEKLMKISQKQSLYMESLHHKLLTKQVDKLNRKNDVK